MPTPAPSPAPAPSPFTLATFNQAATVAGVSPAVATMLWVSRNQAVTRAGTADSRLSVQQVDQYYRWIFAPNRQALVGLLNDAANQGILREIRDGNAPGAGRAAFDAGAFNSPASY
jgi:hypothetical protein